MAQYQFVDTWHLDAAIDRVYDLVGEPLQYPRWWGDVWLSAEGDGGEPEPGKRIEVVTRGFLPYRIRWALTCTEADRPHRVSLSMDGDFVGTATWLLSEGEGGVVTAQLDFRPDVRKPGVRQLTPVLRPLFSSNHRWAMRRGQEGAARVLRT
jgi:uncharacterized protein YndB with AHSA1/START domain